MPDYDPCVSPLELPLQEWRLQCSAATPVYLPPGPGHSPGTTLAGAFKEAMWICGCIRTQSDSGMVNQPSCNRLSNPPRCLQLADCPVQWLVQPYSVTHRRDLIPSVVLRAPALEGSKPVDHFELWVQLRGRRTINAAATLERAFECMARRGLNVQGTTIPFRIEKIQVGTTISLNERLIDLVAGSWQRVQIHFETPYIISKKDPPSPVPTMALTASHRALELVALDLEDRGTHLDKHSRDVLAEHARDTALDVVGQLRISQYDLTPVDLWYRRSASNQRDFPLRGWVGLVEFQGKINVALPWLLVLTLGVGQYTSAGFGAVSLWLDAGLPST